MSKRKHAPQNSKPPRLPIYDGPTEAYAVDAYAPTRKAPSEHFINTSLVVDDAMYDDAIRVYVDGIEKDQPFYLDVENGRALIEMLTRDLAKLELIIALDPE